MSGWLIAGVGAVYVVVSAELFLKGRVDMSIMFGGYAIAQIGAWMAAR